MRGLFKEYFLTLYMEMRKDKVPQVRMEFVNSIVSMKSFLEYDVDSHLQLFDALSELKVDPDKDVQESVETCED